VSYVVIGHGRTPVGQGWGPKIDACDAVIRLWDWDWQDAEDYGCKYDYGYFELSPRQLDRFHLHNKRTPTINWLGGWLKQRDYPLPPNTIVVDPLPWVRLGLALGGIGTKGKLTFTRGVVAAAWAIDCLASAGDLIVLVGLDNVRAGKAISIEEGYPEAYLRTASIGPFKSYTGGVTKYANHDYAIEGPVLATLAKRKRVELAHAQDVW